MTGAVAAIEWTAPTRFLEKRRECPQGALRVRQPDALAWYVGQ